MNDDRIKNDIMRSFENECDHIDRIDVPDYQTSAEFQTGMSKILNKAAKKPTRKGLANDKLHINHENENKSSRKEVVVLKPQYFRPDPPKSGKAFKAVIAAVAVVCVVAAGIFIRVNNKPETMSPNDSMGALSGNSSNSDNSNSDMLTEGVYITYDKSKYENVTAPKCYYADYQKIEDDSLLDLFKEKPTFDEASGSYIAEDETGYNTYNGNKTGFYIMSYYTKRGNDYDTVGNHNFKKYSTVEELDFMPRNEIKIFLESKISEIVSTGIEFDAYAIKSENYSDDAAAPDNDSVPPRPNASSYEKKWSDATDYYYIRARQTVDKIPIFTGRAGSSDTGTSSFGTQIRAVFTANGLEYLFINAPYKIIEEAQTNGEFITLEKAEEIIKNKFEGLLAFEPITLKTVELVYFPLHSENGLILTPVWEFSDYLGPLYRINAYTGEEII